MSNTFWVIIIALACFVATILSLATNKTINSRIMGVCAAVGIVVAFISYGYGYSYKEGLLPSS